MEQLYEILMDTPFGQRSGVLRLSPLGSRVEGTLSIMKYAGELFGESLADGTCRLFGTFTAAEHTYQYRAMGHITDDKIELTLYRGDGVYALRGRRSAELRAACVPADASAGAAQAF